MKSETVNVHKSFESRVQDLIYNVDEGVGSQFIKLALYVFFVITLMSLYWLSEFWGLKEAEAMDQAQIARQLMTDGSFSTKVIRPAALRVFDQHGLESPGIMLQQPDIVHPPVYPWILSKAYLWVGGSFDAGQKVRAYPPEQWAIVPVGNVATILTGLLIFLIGRRFFEPRLALIATTLFFVSDQVWADGISGLSVSLATLLTTLAVYLTLVAIERTSDGAVTWRWILPFTLASLACALAFLTRYSAGWMLVACGLLITFLIPQRGWKIALAFLALTALFVSPWIIRNIQVCGKPFGLTPQLVHNIDSPAITHSFERTGNPLPSGAGDALKTKWTSNIARHYDTVLSSSNNGILAALFIAMFFFRFARNQVHVLRFAMLAAMIGLFLVACLFDNSSLRAMAIFRPFIILYGLAFFYLLLDRMQIAIPVLRTGLIGLLILLTAVPLILKLMPPRSGYPYPPYYPTYVSMVCNMMTADELLGTDMPWATAWYGDRSSLLIPNTIEEFYRINDMQKRIGGLYFTTLTRDLPYVSSLMTGPYSSWYPIFREMIPADFPLTEALRISGRDQIFLTDRPRWPQR